MDRNTFAALKELFEAIPVDNLGEAVVNALDEVIGEMEDVLGDSELTEFDITVGAE